MKHSASRNPTSGVHDGFVRKRGCVSYARRENAMVVQLFFDAVLSFPTDRAGRR